MAVGVVMDFAGATLQQYDQVYELLGRSSPGAAAPTGMLFHSVTETDTGIQVMDVWETKAQFDAFANDQIGPLTAQAGFEGPPQMTFHEVHKYMAADGSQG